MELEKPECVAIELLVVVKATNEIRNVSATLEREFTMVNTPVILCAFREPKCIGENAYPGSVQSHQGLH